MDAKPKPPTRKTTTSSSQSRVRVSLSLSSFIRHIREKSNHGCGDARSRVIPSRSQFPGLPERRSGPAFSAILACSAREHVPPAFSDARHVSIPDQPSSVVWVALSGLGPAGDGGPRAAFARRLTCPGLVCRGPSGRPSGSCEAPPAPIRGHFGCNPTSGLLFASSALFVVPLE